MNTAAPPSPNRDDFRSDEADTDSPRLKDVTKSFLGYVSYINRPSVWPAIARKLRDTLLHRDPSPEELAQMRTEGEAWCAARQVSTAEALQRLGIEDIIDVTAKYPDVFAEAETRAGDVPRWFGAASNLNLLYTLCQHFRPTTIVETGVGHGWSSLTFLLYLREKFVGRLLSSDQPVMAMRNDKWVGIAVPEEMRAHWTIFRTADREALPKITDYAYPVDFAYYDSDPSMDGRRFAYTILWRNLKSGGVLVSDDVDDNMAFAIFCEKISAEPIIIKEPGRNAQGVLVKP